MPTEPTTPGIDRRWLMIDYVSWNDWQANVWVKMVDWWPWTIRINRRGSIMEMARNRHIITLIIRTHNPFFPAREPDFAQWDGWEDYSVFLKGFSDLQVKVLLTNRYNFVWRVCIISNVMFSGSTRPTNERGGKQRRYLWATVTYLSDKLFVKKFQA